MVKGMDMKILQFIVYKIDACNEWIGRIIQWAIIPLVAIFIIESILRKIFSAPQIWFTETSYFIFGYYMMFGSVYTFLHGGHVGIDLLSERLPMKAKHVLAIICFLIFTFVFSLGMIWGGTPIAISSWKAMEQGHSVWRPPIAHFRSVIPVSFIFIFLNGISSVIKHAAAIKGIEL